MPTPTGPSSPHPLTAQELAAHEVLTSFDAYARVRAARDGVLPSSRVGPREEERAFDELQQAIARLRTTSRPR
ncbi:hypothetical protein J8N05_19080 [Streptomyces sp. BH-SS-21]|uniref:Uncharacterized protein n=1 Tax=Streptomyces liliiviolaceus TaxID=2823109 RepID=A0A940XQS0_9ACTN|nr:hypothetical protein [Streptomyces liliiviolaceus]MBQ0850294.1 hypothetical protein [Streptomyces liliiviolaceus]